MLNGWLSTYRSSMPVMSRSSLPAKLLVLSSPQRGDGRSNPSCILTTRNVCFPDDGGSRMWFSVSTCFAPRCLSACSIVSPGLSVKSQGASHAFGPSLRSMLAGWTWVRLVSSFGLFCTRIGCVP